MAGVQHNNDVPQVLRTCIDVQQLLLTSTGTCVQRAFSTSACTSQPSWGWQLP